MPRIDSDEDIYLIACAMVPLDLHFPDRGRIQQTRNAKLICAGCVMRTPCLEQALQRNEPYGIWGGMTEAERRVERQRRLLSVAS